MGRKKHSTSGSKSPTPPPAGRRPSGWWISIALCGVAVMAIAMAIALMRHGDVEPGVKTPPASAGTAPGAAASVSSSAAVKAGETPDGAPGAVAPVRFEDFVGSDACAKCHAREYALWTNSTHGRAGGLPGEVSTIARFDGRPLRFRDATVTPTTNRAGEYVFWIDEPAEPRVEVKVDAVIGGGHLYGGGTQSFFARQPDGTYRFLPFDFIRRENLWFVQLRRDLTWKPITPEISLNEDLANWPPRRVLGTASEFSNCQNCHGSQITLQHDPSAHAYQTRFQTLRINCESCHGPARRHVEIVSRPGWESRADLGLGALALQTKKASMQTCHQCHANKDAIRDEPYLPGAPFEEYFSLKLGMLTDNPFLPDGRVARFSYQSNHEFSDCYLNGSMTCVDCHDPHSQGYRDVFGRALEGRFDNGQCTGCHASKGLTAEAHSHHKSDSPGNRCVACHMPYLQHQGIGRHLVFGRSDHSIPIPRPAFDAGLGIENACQKCHAEKDLSWQQGQVERWYGSLKPHPPLIAALASATGSAPAPAPVSSADAARVLLDPGARHPMAQAAVLARFIADHVRPGGRSIDAEVLRRLQALADDSDPDLQALAWMALQVGYGGEPAVRDRVAARLEQLPPDGGLRRRWAIAADQLGAAFAARGDLADAVACFENALTVHARNEVILSHLALAQFRMGNGDAAIATLKKAIDVRPTKAPLHFQLAQLFAQMQRRQEAIGALEAGLKHSPADGNARAMLEHLRAGGP